ncbi:hypothetical protein [Mycobacterium neglectum]|nr:hypothetical protein [Mycobacterium neglectum]
MRRHLRKSLGEFVCELGWMRQGTDMTAGQLDDVAAKLAPRTGITSWAG